MIGIKRGGGGVTAGMLAVLWSWLLSMAVVVRRMGETVEMVRREREVMGIEVEKERRYGGTEGHGNIEGFWKE